MMERLEDVAMHDVKARQQRFVELVQNDGALDRVSEFVHPDIVDHSRPPGAPGGVDGVSALLGMIRDAFPDHDAEVTHMIAEGDLVATYKTFTGTHLGDFFGIPATGRRATIRVMDFVRYRDDQIAEHWNIVDVAGLTAQLTAAA